MSSDTYEEFADDYVGMIDRMSGRPDSVMGIAAAVVVEMLGEVARRQVADIGCGEGHLARMIARRGGHVTAIDQSTRLIKLAKQRTGQDENVQFAVDDARGLTSLSDESFDAAVCNLVLMDVDHFEQVYRAVRRILRPRARFVFTITHPCFQSPFTDIALGEKGFERHIRIYETEGRWFSDDSNTIRGRVGAYHRKLSAYVNALVNVGFTIDTLAEPTLPQGDYPSASSRIQIEIPSVLAVSALRN